VPDGYLLVARELSQNCDTGEMRLHIFRFRLSPWPFCISPQNQRHDGDLAELFPV
jgi:hypothetical protein